MAQIPTIEYIDVHKTFHAVIKHQTRGLFVFDRHVGEFARNRENSVQSTVKYLHRAPWASEAHVGQVIQSFLVIVRPQLLITCHETLLMHPGVEHVRTLKVDP